MHRRHHSPNRAPLGAAIGIALALAACAPATRPDPPGFLGALIDRPPPAVQVKASGPYGNPLGESVTPLLQADIADAIVAGSLRPSLSAAAGMNLAEASERAAAATTGSIVLWQSADSVGAVVPARDPYRSHRGEICRDLQQQAQVASGRVIDQVTLCHHDLGDGRILWLPGTPD
jgi:surface antigen